MFKTSDGNNQMISSRKLSLPDLWKNNISTFAVSLQMKYLSDPVTSVSSELVSSKAGQLRKKNKLITVGADPSKM